jgi:CRP-like cAMP-binding protein
MRTDSNHIDTYLHMPLFAGCTRAEVEDAARDTTRVPFAAGKVLATQRRPCRQFGLIVAGSVAVQRDGEDIDVLEPGDHFGEFTVLRGLPNPTTLVARTPVTIDVVTGPEFRKSFAADPVLRERIDRECDRRIRDWVRSPVPASLDAVPTA